MDLAQKCHDTDLTFLQTLSTSNKSVALTDKIIMQQYNEYCRLHNIRIFGKLDSHVCSNACQFWEYKNKTKQCQLAFVCKHSRLIHRCGKTCTKQTLTQNREGWTCSLTAYEVAGGPEVSYVSQSRDTFSATKTLGNNYIRMGKRSKVRRSHSKKSFPHIKIIHHAVVAIMTGDKRLVQYNTNIARFLKEITHLKHPTSSSAISFTETNLQIISVLETFKHMLIKPAQKNDRRLTILSTAIVKFWEKFADIIHFSIKTIATFTAVCISKLRTGYNIGNIIVFPQTDWVDRHAPTDIQFAGVYGIRCRNMSILWRKIQEQILSPHSNLPIRTMVFDPIHLSQTISY